MGYNYNIFAIAPYGPYWRQIRKTVVLELPSGRRMDFLRPKRESHVRKSIKRTFEHWSNNKDAATCAVTLEMKQTFNRLVTNMWVSMLFGEDEVEEEGKLDKSIHRLFRLFGEPVVADFIPWLRWLDIGRHERAMRQTAMEMDNFVKKWMEEYRRKGILSLRKKKKKTTSWTPCYHYLMVYPIKVDTDCVIKSTCLTILLAATDTTSITLAWALSLVLNNYKVMERIQDELDTHIGNERCVEQSDIKQLNYLQAVIKETLRLYPPAPLVVPHEAIEDCTIDGYHIKKGTRILPNFVKIYRDPMVWTNPNEFIPERFLTDHKDVDVRGNHFELIPFGSVRRICPGISFGLQIVQLTVANQIHSFDMKRLSNEPIDLTESVGLTNHKATPLRALFVPRLASNLYG